MAFDISNAADEASKSVNIEPNIVFCIDGVTNCYGARIIEARIKIGDPGLEIGGFTIGGLGAIQDQETLIDLKGSTSQISQLINPDTGSSTSISSMKIELTDKDGQISTLITPDDSVSPTFDLLGRKAKIWLGFQGTEFKDDFIVLFRGVIDDLVATAGSVIINLAHPITKVKSEIFPKVETELNGSLTDVATTMTVDSSTGFLLPFTGPDTTIDPTVTLYVRIDDEIIRYEASTATTLDTLTRGQLGTTAVAHDDNSAVESFVRLTGTAMDLSLKLLLSGKNGDFVSSVSPKHFVNINSTDQVANSIFFEGVKLNRDYGLVTGDFCSSTGTAGGTNDATDKVINQIVDTDDGSYLVLAGVTFVQELDTVGTVSFRSQYDVLGEGVGLDPDEVDVTEFESVKQLFLSSFNYDFYIKDTIENAKDFIAKELLNPAGAYDLPRKSQVSLGMHSGPLPGANIVTLDASNVLNPGQLAIRRTTNKNFHNTVSYTFEEAVLTDKLLRIDASSDADSVAQIKVGINTLKIQSKGMRTTLNGDTLAAAATTRRLRKYKYAAEMIDNMRVNYKTGFNIEVGDVVLVDMASLKLTDIKEGGTRSGESRLFQIDNKKMNLRGEVTLKLVDTNYDKDARYGSIAPSSNVKSGTSSTVFIIEESYSSVFGVNEFKKWENLVGASVRIHNSTYSISGTGLISLVNGNTITVNTALGFTPAAGYIMSLDDYDNQTEDVKLKFVFASDGTNAFADGGLPYQFY